MKKGELILGKVHLNRWVREKNKKAEQKPIIELLGYDTVVDEEIVVLKVLSVGKE